MFYKVITAVFTTVSLGMLSGQSIAADAARPTLQQWTLESSIQQAMTVAPELKKSMTTIGASEADMKMSSLWPDPSIEFRVDNKLGKDDGSGGYDLTDVTISQAIPFSRLKNQKLSAEASFKSAQFLQKHSQLQVQNRVSKVFHELQLASANMQLMERRLAFANQLNHSADKKAKGVVVRYLTPLEKMRISVIREEANQAVSNAEGKYYEALNEFTKLLGLDAGADIHVAELQAIEKVPALDFLSDFQEKHPQLVAQQQRLQSANADIEVARKSQVADPVVSLSRSEDSFASGREDVYALMLNIQIPLQDRKSSAVSKAGFKASEQRIELQRLKRELQINLKRSVTHANHIVEQASSYKQKVLKPAKKILDLTKKGFTSGELNMLSLVDATNTYFDARVRYLDLLYQAHAELADIYLFAGHLITDSDTQYNATTKDGL